MGSLWTLQLNGPGTEAQADLPKFFDLRSNLPRNTRICHIRHVLILGLPHMDPSRPESFNHRTELLSTGRTYHFVCVFSYVRVKVAYTLRTKVDQVPNGYQKQRNPTLLCIHGFPDFWYGWRYQIGPWTRRGYRVVVPDMLGFGGSSKPKDAIEYSTKRLCADLTALLDLLKIDNAVRYSQFFRNSLLNYFVLVRL